MLRRMKKEHKENPLISIVVNIVVPALIMSKLSSPERLGPVWSVVVALAFPVTYGGLELVRAKKVNFISLLGVISVLLTGIFAILELPPEWIAWKEAGVPFFIGLLVILSAGTRFCLLKKILLNEQLVDTKLLNAKLEEQGNVEAFSQALKRFTWGLASSFFLSSVLNYGLAKYLLRSKPGTEAFTQELGKMTAMSYPVIVLPSMVVMCLVLWRLITCIETLSGLHMDEVFWAAREDQTEEPAEQTD